MRWSGYFVLQLDAIVRDLANKTIVAASTMILATSLFFLAIRASAISANGYYQWSQQTMLAAADQSSSANSGDTVVTSGADEYYSMSNSQVLSQISILNVPDPPPPSSSPVNQMAIADDYYSDLTDWLPSSLSSSIQSELASRKRTLRASSGLTQAQREQREQRERDREQPNQIQDSQSMMFTVNAFQSDQELTRLPCLVGQRRFCSDIYIITWYKQDPANSNTKWTRLETIFGQPDSNNNGIGGGGITGSTSLSDTPNNINNNNSNNNNKKPSFYFNWHKQQQQGPYTCQALSSLSSTASNESSLTATTTTIAATTSISQFNCHELIIKNALVKDEGDYKCIVTYSGGYGSKCPSVTQTRLNILAYPREAEILVNGVRLIGLDNSSKQQLGNSQMLPLMAGPFKEGTQVRMECQSWGGRPQPQIEWINMTLPPSISIPISHNINSASSASFPLGSNGYSQQQLNNNNRPIYVPMRSQWPVKYSNKTNESGDIVTNALITFTISRFDLRSLFACLVEPNPALGQAINAAGVGMGAIGNPSIKSSMQQMPNNQILRGQQMHHQLVKYLQFDVHVKPSNVTISIERRPKLTVSSSSSFMMQQSRLADQHLMSRQQQQHHQANEATITRDQVSGVGGTINGRNNNIELVQLDEIVLIKCTVFGSRPPTNITWYNKTEELTHQPENQLELTPEATYRSTSVLMFNASMADDSAEFFCKATNPVFKFDEATDAPPIASMKFLVTYPPMVWLEASATIVDNLVELNESDSLELRCHFAAHSLSVVTVGSTQFGSQLGAQFTWFKDGHLLVADPPESQLEGSHQSNVMYSEALPTSSSSSSNQHLTAFKISISGRLLLRNVTQSRSNGLYSCSCKLTPSSIMDNLSPTTMRMGLPVATTSSALPHHNQHYQPFTGPSSSSSPSPSSSSATLLDGSSSYRSSNSFSVRVKHLVRTPNIRIVSSRKLDHYDIKRLDDGQKLNGSSQMERIIVVEFGASISLKCDDSASLMGSGNDEPNSNNNSQYANNNNYIWFFNDRLIPPAINRYHEFKIAEFNYDHLGTYTCLKMNGVHRSNQIGATDGLTPSLVASGISSVEKALLSPKINLQIRAPQKLINELPFITRIKMGPVSGNETQRFKCQAQCQPLCQVQWWIHDQIIGASTNDVDDTTIAYTIKGHDYRLRTRQKYLRNPRTNSWTYWSSYFLDGDANQATGLDRPEITIDDDNQHNLIQAHSISELILQDRLIVNALADDSVTIKCAIQPSKSNGNEQSPRATDLESKTRVFVERAPWSLRMSQGDPVELSKVSKLFEITQSQHQVIPSTLSCSAKGYPEPRYEWKYIDSNQIERDIVADGQSLDIVNLIKLKLEQTTITTTAIKPNTIESILAIVGNYTCSAINIHGVAKDSFNLQLKGGPVCQLTRGKEQSTGNNEHFVDLECDIYSYWQPIDITWFNRNKILLKNSSRSMKQLNGLISNNDNYHQTVILPIMIHNGQQNLIKADNLASNSNNVNNLDLYRCLIRDHLGQTTYCQLEQQDLDYMQSYKEFSLTEAAIQTANIISEKILKFPSHNHNMNATKFLSNGDEILTSSNNAHQNNLNSNHNVNSNAIDFHNISQNFIVNFIISLILVVILILIIYILVVNIVSGSRMRNKQPQVDEGNSKEFSPRSSPSSNSNPGGCLLFKRKVRRGDYEQDDGSGRNDFSGSILVATQQQLQSHHHNHHHLRSTATFDSHQLQLYQNDKDLTMSHNHHSPILPGTYSTNATASANNYLLSKQQQNNNSSMDSMTTSTNDGSTSLNINAKTLLSRQQQQPIYNNNHHSVSAAVATTTTGRYMLNGPDNTPVIQNPYSESTSSSSDDWLLRQMLQTQQKKQQNLIDHQPALSHLKSLNRPNLRNKPTPIKPDQLIGSLIGPKKSSASYYKHELTNQIRNQQQDVGQRNYLHHRQYPQEHIYSDVIYQDVYANDGFLLGANNRNNQNNTNNNNNNKSNRFNLNLTSNMVMSPPSIYDNHMVVRQDTSSNTLISADRLDKITHIDSLTLSPSIDYDRIPPTDYVKASGPVESSINPKQHSSYSSSFEHHSSQQDASGQHESGNSSSISSFNNNNNNNLLMLNDVHQQSVNGAGENDDDLDQNSILIRQGGHFDKSTNSLANNSTNNGRAKAKSGNSTRKSMQFGVNINGNGGKHKVIDDESITRV